MLEKLAQSGKKDVVLCALGRILRRLLQESGPGGERMAVAENAYRSGVSLKLNAGTNAATGRMIVKGCSLGKVKPGADAEAVVRVVDLLAAVLEYPVVRMERTEVSTLEKQ